MKRVLTGTILKPTILKPTILKPGMVAFAIAAMVYAQAAMTGRWQGETRNGTRITLDLTVTEKALTGTIIRNGESIKIDDGKVSKNSLTFRATIGDQTEAFTAELAGEQLKVWLDRQGPDSAVVMKRIKD